MKKLIKTFALANLLSLGIVFAGSSINAMRVPGNVSDIGPNSKAWLSASYANVIVYPQSTIKLNYKSENAQNTEKMAKNVKVKAIYDGKNISFLIKWSNDTQSIQEGYSSTAYSDGFALQFPVKYKDASKLPYIGMGSEGRAVVIHLKKMTGLKYEENENVYIQVNADTQNAFGEDLQKYKVEVTKKAISDYQRVFIAEGFASMTEVIDNSIKGKMQMQYRDGFWMGTLSRKLKDDYLDLDKGVFPIAFSLWGGDEKNRDGLKLFSSWAGVKLVGSNGGNELLETLNKKPQGSVQNGKKIAHENCAACHRYNGEINAPAFMGPNLSNIGGYSTKEYLMESIMHPSAVVVAGYNKTVHTNFEWYTLDEKNKRISTMPSYDWMDEKSRSDLVAYFMSLKAKVE
jgi:hypothetical protein